MKNVNVLEEKIKWSKYENLDEDQWTHLSCNKLTEDFIEHFQDKVDWEMISLFQKLNESFIEKHQNQVRWDYISDTQKLSEDFIWKFRDKVSWIHIIDAEKVSRQFINEHKLFINQALKNEHEKTEYV